MHAIVVRKDIDMYVGLDVKLVSPILQWHAGFLGPFQADIVDSGHPLPKAQCGDACMQLNIEQQKNRADLAEKIKLFASLFPGLTKEHLGSKGHSVFAKELDYILLANFFLIPFARALLFGLLKDFWFASLPPKTGDHRPERSLYLRIKHQFAVCWHVHYCALHVSCHGDAGHAVCVTPASVHTMYALMRVDTQETRQ